MKIEDGSVSGFDQTWVGIGGLDVSPAPHELAAFAQGTVGHGSGCFFGVVLVVADHLDLARVEAPRLHGPVGYVDHDHLGNQVQRLCRIQKGVGFSASKQMKGSS